MINPSAIVDNTSFAIDGSACGATTLDPAGNSMKHVAIDSAYANRKHFLYTPGPNAILPAITQEPKGFASFDPKKPVADSLAEANIPFETVSAISLTKRFRTWAISVAPRSHEVREEEESNR